MTDPNVPRAVSAFVAALPKVELHVHIEGTLTPALRWRLAQKNGIALPYKTYDALLASYATMYNHRRELHGDNGLPTFLEAYYGGMEVLRTEEDFYDLAMEYFAKAGEMNVRYADPFFDPQAHTRRGVPLEAVMRGFERAGRDAKEKYGVAVGWTMCFLRDMPPENALATYEAAVRDFGGVFHAIGLDSNEFNRPPRLFAEVFRRARVDGYKITAHCDVGQKDTHEHIREVATRCVGGVEGADRIDHGLNIADQPELLALVKEKGLGLTLCPHAYHRRLPTDWVFGSIRKVWQAGIPFSVASDDPTYMHQQWVTENLGKVMHYCGFQEKDMVKIQRDGVAMSWAPEDVKEAIFRELDRFEKQCSS
ncbi:adenosine deaminase [Schizophyllum commune]